MQEVVRLICASRIDRSNTNDSVRSTLHTDREKSIDESVGKNPTNINRNFHQSSFSYQIYRRLKSGPPARFSFPMTIQDYEMNVWDDRDQ